MKTHPVVRLVAFALLLLVIPAALSSTSSAQIAVGIAVRIAPPALPVYEQPLCPGPGYLWTPGYWAWDDDAGYYWVPGTWVVAPVGLLWTPGYWGWNDGVYAFNEGYWGPEIGFYGGINYGFGYGGEGFYGGEWRGGAFFYNTAVMRVDETRITNVYVNRTVIVNNESHVAFNGGEGGVAARPSPHQEEYARQPHTRPVAAQVQHQREASHNRQLFASVNHGAPAVAATAKPGQFSGQGVVRAKAAGAPYHAPAISPKAARASAPANNRSAASSHAKTAAPATKSRPASEPHAKTAAPATKSRPASEPHAKTAAPATKSRPASEPRAKAAAPAAKSRPANEPHAKTAAPAAKAHPASEPHAKTAAPAAKSRPASEPHAKTAAPAAKAHPASEPHAKTAAPAPKAHPAPAPHAQNTPAPKASSPQHSAPKPSQSAPKPEKQSAPPKQEHKGK